MQYSLVRPITLKKVSVRPVASQSEIAEIKELFREMQQQYATYQPKSYYLPLKRVMDVSISMTFIILILSWLYPIVALLIRISSKGPVLFIQKRTGYLGMEFDCLKFRTMYLNAEADSRQATYRDTRITPLGRLLRATHIDELPQLFNVLMGDMSIIGPRPHMLYHTRYYAGIIPYYNLRHEAKPGLTGMAQIKGFIGEINAERDLRKRVQWDIYYLKNRCISLDIRIFFRTIFQTIGKTLHLLKRNEA